MAENELGGRGRVVALVRDLMFAARVRGAAPGASVGQRGEEVLEAVGPATALVVVELEASDALEVIEGAVERGAGRVVAFAPHVREELMAAGRDAGAEVLARGAFVKRLPQLVREAEEAG
jgi:hypothetical protein